MKSKNFLFSILHNSWILTRLWTAKSAYLIVCFWWNSNSLRIEIITSLGLFSLSKLCLFIVPIISFSTERLFFSSSINSLCLSFVYFGFLFDDFEISIASLYSALISSIISSTALDNESSLWNENINI